MIKKWIRLTTYMVALVWILMLAACASEAKKRTPPVADMHIHYNWDQREVISAQEVITRLQAANVVMTLVAGTPSELALELQKAGGDWVIPFFSPYIRPNARHTWYRLPEVIEEARAGLSAGLYRGIGEVHFMAGTRPWPDDPGFVSLVQLAKQFKVPMLIHVDASEVRYYVDLCRQYPTVTLILAHAGGVYRAGQIDEILTACANTMVDLSARDPWRYGGLTDAKGELTPDWQRVLLAHPLRFMIGTDPVWRVTRTQSWDEADDGWDHFTELMDFHLSWLAYLPDDVAEAVRYKNALRLFGDQER